VRGALLLHHAALRPGRGAAAARPAGLYDCSAASSPARAGRPRARVARWPRVGGAEERSAPRGASPGRLERRAAHDNDCTVSFPLPTATRWAPMRASWPPRRRAHASAAPSRFAGAGAGQAW
jgi:hypothetical protein